MPSSDVKFLDLHLVEFETVSGILRSKKELEESVGFLVSSGFGRHAIRLPREVILLGRPRTNPDGSEEGRIVPAGITHPRNRRVERVFWSIWRIIETVILRLRRVVPRGCKTRRANRFFLIIIGDCGSRETRWEDNVESIFVDIITRDIGEQSG
jgi:hypothetical protein